MICPVWLVIFNHKFGNKGWVVPKDLVCLGHPISTRIQLGQRNIDQLIEDICRGVDALLIEDKTIRSRGQLFCHRTQSCYQYKQRITALPQTM